MLSEESYGIKFQPNGHSSSFIYYFFLLCTAVRSLIFPKMMIYKTGCLHALDLIY